MLADALGTYVTAIGLIAVATALGAGIMALTGARRLTPVAPVVGLAAASVIAWWAVRLPGHGLTALVVLVVVAAIAGAYALIRLDDAGAVLVRLLPTGIVALAAVSIPFVAEGHFGVLGTGFNVDMSQHLFAAGWLADPEGLSPSLFRNGYPLGPHALAVAGNEVTGELSIAFTGVTIAVPVIAALTALAALDSLSRMRALAVSVLTALAYLLATYLAQGAFKELFEAAFLLGFALWLRDLTRHRSPGGARHPPARSRRGDRRRRPLRLQLARAGLAGGDARALGASPSSSGAVPIPEPRCAGSRPPRSSPSSCSSSSRRRSSTGSASSGRASTPSPSARRAHPGTGRQARSPGAAAKPAPKFERPDYDNDLGNLFGQINPASVFGVWPSGDFRVNPGDGAVPAPVFYLGALLGAVALGLGVAAAWRQAETALLAALAAAAAIWLAARIGSTPYTNAKALQMLAPIVMLLAARGLLDPLAPLPLRRRSPRALAALAAAFAAAAALSSALALANAPVGPDDYTPGVRKLANRFGGQPTLLLAPAA